MTFENIKRDFDESLDLIFGLRYNKTKFWSFVLTLKSQSGFETCILITRFNLQRAIDRMVDLYDRFGQFTTYVRV